jgi:hypothetical protein
VSIENSANGTGAPGGSAESGSVEVDDVSSGDSGEVSFDGGQHQEDRSETGDTVTDRD